MALLEHERADEVPRLAARQPFCRRSPERDAPHAGCAVLIDVRGIENVVKDLQAKGVKL